MGLGIAESFVIAGLDVVFAEVTPERAQGSPSRLADRMRAHVDAGLIVDAAARARRRSAPRTTSPTPCATLT